MDDDHAATKRNAAASTQPRTPSEADIETFIRWLELKPPYELVGRVVCEAAAVEIGMIDCARQAGTDRSTLGKMRTRQVLDQLRRRPHHDVRITPLLLDRVEQLLDTRDVLAHSAPMNLWGRPQHGFVKLNRPTNQNFLWHGFESQELEAIARELAEIAELLQSVTLSSRSATAPAPQ